MRVVRVARDRCGGTAPFRGLAETHSETEVPSRRLGMRMVLERTYTAEGNTKQMLAPADNRPESPLAFLNGSL